MADPSLIQASLNRLQIESGQNLEVLTSLTDHVEKLTQAGMKQNDLLQKQIDSILKQNAAILELSDLLRELIKILPDVLGQEIAKLITSRSS